MTLQSYISFFSKWIHGAAAWIHGVAAYPAQGAVLKPDRIAAVYGQDDTGDKPGAVAGKE